MYIYIYVVHIYIYAVIMNEYVKPIYYRIPGNRYWCLATLAFFGRRGSMEAVRTTAPPFGVHSSSKVNGPKVFGYPIQVHSSTWNYKWI